MTVQSYLKDRRLKKTAACFSYVPKLVLNADDVHVADVDEVRGVLAGRYILLLNLEANYVRIVVAAPDVTYRQRDTLLIPRSDSRVCSAEGVPDESSEYGKRNVDAGMPQVVHIIETINIFDIKVVVVAPAGWPSFIESERKAAVLEAVIPANQLGTHHVERVVMTEIGAVTVVRNAAIMVAVVATVGSNGLGACGFAC